MWQSAPTTSSRPSNLGDHSDQSSSKANLDPLSLVCSTCRTGPFSREGFRQAVAETHSDPNTGYCYTTTWAAISRSITNEACNWCTIVKRTRDGLTTSRFPPVGQEIVEIGVRVGTESKKMTIYLDGHKCAEYFIYAKPEDTAVEEIGEEVYFFSKEPFVDWEKAVECMNRCKDHEHCPEDEETYLPTRVIDCSDPSKPRLVHTNREVRGHYCNLSYVWGGDQPLKTTLSNIDTYINDGITLPIPQTIADAIFVTNKLGFKYLWVDALCIIQDSVEDKNKELGIMSNIYADAYLTISALSSFRADQGFLPNERGPDVLPFICADRAKPAGHMLLDIYIPRQMRGKGKYETVIMHQPLEERGWCMQESILSPRRLIFQPPHLYYKCRSFGTMELSRSTRFTKFQHPRVPSAVKDYIIFPPPRKQGAAFDISNEELRKRWGMMLRDYTGRSISVPCDKFVALASIAELFQSSLKDEYIAGLWRQTLLSDLLWEVWPPMGPDERLLPRPAVYRAPTWSWASTDRLLGVSSFYPPPSATCYEADILACSAAPKVSTLPFGEITAATLTLRAKVRPLMRDGSRCVFTTHQGTRSGDAFLSHKTGSWWSPPPGNCLQPQWSEDSPGGIIFDCQEGTETERPMDFYVIILRAGKKWQGLAEWMHGLLVLRVDGEVEQYRRVAKLALLSSDKNFHWPDWFDDAPLQIVALV